jgi:hypothetical protein
MALTNFEQGINEDIISHVQHFYNFLFYDPW